MRKTEKVSSNSFHGDTVIATVKELTNILGSPSFSENLGDSKTNYEWMRETSQNGYPVYIYDWKEYRRINDDEMIEWHIATAEPSHSKEALNEINSLLGRS